MNEYSDTRQLLTLKYKTTAHSLIQDNCSLYNTRQMATLYVRRLAAEGGCNVVPKILAANLCFHNPDPVFLYLVKSETI